MSDEKLKGSRGVFCVLLSAFGLLVGRSLLKLHDTQPNDKTQSTTQAGQNSVAPDNVLEARKPLIEGIDEERKHLETLYQERINFFLVFTSVLIVGLSDIKDECVREWALWVTVLVSAIMTASLIRTFRLVWTALEHLKKIHPRHPYRIYAYLIRHPGNANFYLFAVPIIITVFFICLAVHYSHWHCRPESLSDFPF